MEALKAESASAAAQAADLKQENAELASKYSLSEKRVSELTAELTSVQGKLEMTQVNLEQLRSAQAAAEIIEPTTISQTSTHESELKVRQSLINRLGQKRGMNGWGENKLEYTHL